MSSVAPNYEASIEFLRRFHPNRNWVLTSISLDKRNISTKTFNEATAGKCLEWLKLAGFERNIYFSVGEVDKIVEKKADREDISRVWYLHVDIDPRAGEDIESEQKRALALLQNPPGLQAPTVITFSGGGYQAFWALREPFETKNTLELAEEAKLYNLQIEIALGADNVHNIDRIMRLPGTLNRPDALKVKKGRKPALAQVVEWHEDRTYTLAQFTKAPLVQTGEAGFIGTAGGTSKPKVKVSGNVRRIESVDELPEQVSGRAKVIICQGVDPDEPTKFAGRSEWLFYVCCELVRGGCDDDTIYSIITDPKFEISKSVLDKGSMTEKYALRQIERAREDAHDPDLRAMNEQFAVISNWSGKCRVVEEQFDESMGRFRLTKQTFEDFRNRLMHRKKTVGQNVRGEDITRGMGEWWLQESGRRQFDKIVFAPGKDVPGSYNLWRGFACDARPGDCSLFLTHLRENICQGNEVHYDYLIKWMARAVQMPDSPGYSSVVFRGGQGTGKSFVAKTLGSLFGRHFMQVTDPKHLVGSFNSHLRDCVFLFGDEAFYAGDKKHESVLKMLITEEMITIEAKGVDAEVSGNCIHLMMASNDAWVVPAGMDDRRFFVLDVGIKSKNDASYFQAINDQLRAGGREALLHHLLTLDLKGYEVRNVPKTAALQQQKMFSMGSQDGWWFEKLRDGRLLAEHGDWRLEVVVNDLHQDFLDYCRQFNVARRGTAFSLRQTIEGFLPKGLLGKYQTNSPVETTTPSGEKKMIPRPYWYRIPSLEVCRKHWDENFGGPYDWESVEMRNVPQTPEVF
jgi:hypothetical protein